MNQLVTAQTVKIIIIVDNVDINILQNLALEKLAEQYVHPLFTASTLVEKLMPQLCKEVASTLVTVFFILCYTVIYILMYGCSIPPCILCIACHQ